MTALPCLPIDIYNRLATKLGWLAFCLYFSNYHIFFFGLIPIPTKEN